MPLQGLLAQVQTQHTAINMNTALVCSRSAQCCAQSSRQGLRRPAVVVRALVTRPAQQRLRSLRVRAQVLEALQILVLVLGALLWGLTGVSAVG
jgi:hypothetical protein